MPAILLIVLYSACSNKTANTLEGTPPSKSVFRGSDLSYVNHIISNGGVYRDEQSNIINPYAFFAEKGNDVVRIRLWHTPENTLDARGNPITSSNLNDVVLAFQRAKAEGMDLMLNIHYGDHFRDPGNQQMPLAWQGLNHTDLLTTIYDYTHRVLERLKTEGVIPQYITIGNETTWGFIDPTATPDGFEWPEDAEKFNAAIDAVDDFEMTNNVTILKVLSATDSSVEWLVRELQDNGVSNFDIIGVDYYPFFSHLNSLNELGDIITNLRTSYENKDVLILETAGSWIDGSTTSADGYSNHIVGYNNLPYSMTSVGQAQFLSDLLSLVASRGGIGILYWEPAWISSDLADPWGIGTSYEHNSLFDFQNNNQALPAFNFFSESE